MQENAKKVYATIWGYCSKTIQNRIEAHTTYETLIRDDPIELLKAIKIMMHDPERAKYPYASLKEALTRMINIKQLEKESLLDYVKRFKQTRDIMESQLGNNILDKFIENMLAYHAETNMSKQATLKTKAFPQWMAYLVM